MRSGKHKGESQAPDELFLYSSFCFAMDIWFHVNEQANMTPITYNRLEQGAMAVGFDVPAPNTDRMCSGDVPSAEVDTI